MATAKHKSTSSSKCPSRGHRYSPAERGVIVDPAKAKGVAVAAREHRCSTWTIYRWLSQEIRTKARSKAVSAARPAIPIDAATPASGAVLSPEQEERHQLVLQLWHEQPGLGPSPIRNQLRRRGFKASVHTVREVMEDHGYVQPRVNT